MITLENVTKVYQTKSGPITAMDDVDLQIKEGEIFGIIGYSGAGKSTLIRTLNGLEKTYRRDDPCSRKKYYTTYLERPCARYVRKSA